MMNELEKKLLKSHLIFLQEREIPVCNNCIGELTASIKSDFSRRKEYKVRLKQALSEQEYIKKELGDL